MLIFLFSCSSKFKSTKELGLKPLVGPSLSLSNELESGKVEQFNYIGNEGTLFFLKLSSPKEAKQYAMERRLILIRKFENIIEPYFGSANAVTCKENIKTHLLSKTDQNLKAALQLLSFGEDRVLRDCLVEGNTHWLRVEMFACGSNFYDLRIYQPVTNKVLPYEFLFDCP